MLFFTTGLFTTGLFITELFITESCPLVDLNCFLSFGCPIGDLGKTALLLGVKGGFEAGSAGFDSSGSGRAAHDKPTLLLLALKLHFEH